MSTKLKQCKDMENQEIKTNDMENEKKIKDERVYNAGKNG